MSKNLILTINPGSTSLKIGIFEAISADNIREIFVSKQAYPKESLENAKSVIDLLPVAQKAVEKLIIDSGIDTTDLAAVAGRGGLMRPLSGGTYTVNEKMLEDLKTLRYGKHASNLGAILADIIAKPLNIPAFIVNPVVVDEMDDIARLSGHPLFIRKSAFHALNQKSIAQKAAKQLNKGYNELNMIIAHIGGGISVAAHKNGRVIDVNNGLEEGPFSPERTGNIPVLQLVELCFSGKYQKADIDKMLVGKGGIMGYLGTSDLTEVSKLRNNGDKDAKQLFEAMAYQISKEIAANSAVLFGKVDAIVLTGGAAYSNSLVGLITERVSHIAQVMVFPGENELYALAEGAYSVVSGTEQAKVY